MAGQTLLRSPHNRRLITLAFVALGAIALPAPGQTATAPSIAGSQTAGSQPATAEIDSLARQLGDVQFERRERAQQHLTALGELALPALLKHLRDPDPEIARRVTELLPIPADPTRRVDVAMQLLATGDREHLRKAVVLLFQEPGKIDEAFRTAVAGASGLAAAVAVPILEQMTSWREQDRRYRKNAEANAARNPDGVARLSQLHAETPAYLAEAAYWLALEARDDYLERTTTRPERTNPSPTTQHR